MQPNSFPATEISAGMKNSTQKHAHGCIILSSNYAICNPLKSQLDSSDAAFMNQWAALEATTTEATARNNSTTMKLY
jgi:hypothetical protein